MVEVRRTYQYRLYRCDKRDKHLHHQIDVAGTVWNHALLLQKRHYRLTKKYIPLGVMQAHFAKLRMKTQRYAFWKVLQAQTVQNILERLDNGYQLFFKRLARRPPKYKKVRQRKSFTLKQTGYKLLEGNTVKISGRVYKYVKHREMQGIVKTLTVKRDSLRRLWLIFTVAQSVSEIQVTTRRGAGFDFGLKTFLTDHTGKEYTAGLPHRDALKRLRTLQGRKDKKAHRTNNRKKAAKLLSRSHIRIKDKRRDAHYKLAHQLCNEYDVLHFENLNIEAMKRRWGRKVSDLAFGDFLLILKHVAAKRGKMVVMIDRFERTTGKCSACGHLQTLELRQRIFHCAVCSQVLGRDHNAAINILRAGSSAHTGLEVVSRVPQKTCRLA
jgi:putative transposase